MLDEVRTLIDLSEVPGGPRAAPTDQRWPCELEPGERETAYDMVYIELEEGQIMDADRVEEPVPLNPQWSTASDWYIDMLNHVVSDVVELDDAPPQFFCDPQRLVGGGSHRMGRGGDMKKRRSEWCRL